jgi:BlaI family transcriptional regulator, penicillinase repressor
MIRRKARKRPTDSELAILRILWEKGASTVRQVLAVLNQDRATGYTTALKMMQIMTDKGLIERDESVRPQIYRPSFSREQTERQLVRDLLERAFAGSAKRLVLQALAVKKASAKEMAEVEKLLNKLEEE